jgi:hypothetical protein
MTPKPLIYVGGMLPCLNYGELIDFSKDDIHLCRAEAGAWLKKQGSVVAVLPDGTKFDLKKKVIK